MTELVLGHDAVVLDWAARLLPGVMRGADLGPCVAIGIADRDKLIAAAVFRNERTMAFGKDLEIMFAASSPRWAVRRNIRAIFAYPFRQLGCTRLTTITGRKNKRARKLIEGLGFRLEGVCWAAYDGRTDAIIYGLRRADAQRWLGE